MLTAGPARCLVAAPPPHAWRGDLVSAALASMDQVQVLNCDHLFPAERRVVGLAWFGTWRYGRETSLTPVLTHM